MSAHIKIHTGSSITIHRLAQLLDQENIDYLIKDYAESARLAGFGSLGDDVELFVNPSDVDKAVEVLKQVK